MTFKIEVMNMKYVILIPAYNPDDKFVAFVDELVHQEAPVVVVDDGSKDSCKAAFEHAKQAGFTVVHHEVNRGKGQAIRTGLQAVQEHFSDYDSHDCIITVDCDGQHTLESIHKVAAGAEANPGALVLGGRFQDEENVPLRSRIGNSFTRGVFRLATGLKIHDTQTGLRAIPFGLIDRMISLKGDRYEYEMNMLLYLKEWSIPYAEVPISTIYFDNNAGSHFNTFKDSWLIFRQIIKFISASVASFLVDYGAYVIFAAIFGKTSLAAWSVLLAYAVARIISGVVNYLLNSKMVFKAGGERTFVGYFILWALILGLGSGGSYLIHDLLHWPKVISKLCVDIPLFLFSYWVQREVIFKKKAGNI